MTSTNASEIVESYRAALGKGDFATARKLMQDDMSFQGPFDTFNKADDYLEATRRLASSIQRIDLKKVFVDGDDVCVLYDMVTNTPAGTAFIAEWYQVKTGRSQLCERYLMRAPSRPYLEGEVLDDPTGQLPGGIIRQILLCALLSQRNKR
jgi:hypothetical protein